MRLRAIVAQSSTDSEYVYPSLTHVCAYVRVVAEWGAARFRSKATGGGELRGRKIIQHFGLFVDVTVMEPNKVIPKEAIFGYLVPVLHNSAFWNGSFSSLITTRASGNPPVLNHRKFSPQRSINNIPQVALFLLTATTQDSPPLSLYA